MIKSVLFTGATGGLGTLCVREIAARGGWTVFATGTNEASLAELGRLPDVIPIRMDVTDPESIAAARRTVEAHTGELAAIVNFAGLSAFVSLVEEDGVAAVERLLKVNVLGMARVNQAFFELVRAGHGRIINCSSEAGWMTPQPFAGPYAASKYAVEAYSDSLRRELMFLGIPVIKIQPGAYATQLTWQIREQFDQTLATTRYYGRLLTRMKPLMELELRQRNNPRRLVQAVVTALEARSPRLQYRVGTGKLLALLELLPDRAVDTLYRWIVGR